MQKAKNKLYEVLRDDNTCKAGHIFDTTIVILIILNVIFVILDTFDMPSWYFSFSMGLEYISVSVFTAEYILRVWVAPLARPSLSPGKARLKYIFSFMAVIDLLAVLPFYLSFWAVDLRILHALRIIRLLRVFKLTHYTRALYTIGRVFRKKLWQLFCAVFVIILLTIMASVLMFNVENMAQPGLVENAFSGLWWAITGYNEVYPLTAFGKFLSVFIAMLQVALVAVPTAILCTGFIEVLKEDEKTLNPNPFTVDGLSAADEIAKYKRLMDDGTITPEEFETIKSMLLPKPIE